MSSSGSNKSIILLSGYRGSGKDTAAEYLASKYRYLQLSLAEPLKDLTARKWGIPRHHMDDRKYKEAGITRLPVRSTDAFTETLHEMLRAELVGDTRTGHLYWTPRALLILEGSIHRTVNPDYWLELLARGIRDSDHSRFVISDVRYRNEIEYLSGLGYHTTHVRVDRGIDPGTRDPSERDLDGLTPDYNLINNGTIDELHEGLDLLVEVLGGSR